MLTIKWQKTELGKAKKKILEFEIVPPPLLPPLPTESPNEFSLNHKQELYFGVWEYALHCKTKSFLQVFFDFIDLMHFPSRVFLKNVIKANYFLLKKSILCLCRICSKSFSSQPLIYYNKTMALLFYCDKRYENYE